MSDGRTESSVRGRWEARAKTDYPLHYFIWLRDHKSLKEQLSAINIDGDPVSRVSRAHVGFHDAWFLLATLY